MISTEGMHRNAIIGGECDEFRYMLTRTWQPRQARLLRFVMLNPSTADAQQDDATVRKCIGFAIALGYTGFAIVNLFAFRARDPKTLKAAGYPVGPNNDKFIKMAADDARAEGSDVVCAWGVNARGLDRPREVLAILRRAGVAPKALEFCVDGTPAHPLMLSYDLAKRGLLEFRQ
jgi:hypothetical protein